MSYGQYIYDKPKGYGSYIRTSRAYNIVPIKVQQSLPLAAGGGSGPHLTEACTLWAFLLVLLINITVALIIRTIVA